MPVAAKRPESSSSSKSLSRMWRVALGDTGLGALICETDRGRPLGMSPLADERLLVDEVDLRDDDLLEEEEEDLVLGTSRMFRARPVVGSTVESSLGLCETWYPSMM
jgi:hypothetical protein